MAMREISEIRAGDVLLCCKRRKLNVFGNGIARITHSDYTHAAICIDTSTAAESRLRGGVKKIGLKTLVGRYDHVAVFRQPDAWRSEGATEALSAFIDGVISSRAKYNWKDLIFFRRKVDAHRMTLTDQLHAFFAEESRGRAEPRKQRYFCSELVTDCFIAAGFIDDSAAVMYRSNVTSPGALGRDPTYGTFFGYVSSAKNHAVSSADEFYHHATVDEIFGS